MYAAAVRARVVRPMPAGHERISSATNQPLPLLGFYETLLDPSPTDGFSKVPPRPPLPSVLLQLSHDT